MKFVMANTADLLYADRSPSECPSKCHFHIFFIHVNHCSCFVRSLIWVNDVVTVTRSCSCARSFFSCDMCSRAIFCTFSGHAFNSLWLVRWSWKQDSLCCFMVLWTPEWILKINSVNYPEQVQKMSWVDSFDSAIMTKFPSLVWRSWLTTGNASSLYKLLQLCPQLSLRHSDSLPNWL